jgi:hypothetical protein
MMASGPAARASSAASLSAGFVVGGDQLFPGHYVSSLCGVSPKPVLYIETKNEHKRKIQAVRKRLLKRRFTTEFSTDSIGHKL